MNVFHCFRYENRGFRNNLKTQKTELFSHIKILDFTNFVNILEKYLTY